MGTSAFTAKNTILSRVCPDYLFDMACGDCCVKFSLLKRKKTCCDCKRDFCSACVMRIKCTEKKYRCRSCQILSAVPLDRTAVMGLRVKDIRRYLESKNVCLLGCKEKSELIDLVMQQSGSAGSSRYDSANLSVFHMPPYYQPNYDDSGRGCGSSGCASAQGSPLRTFENPNSSSGPPEDMDTSIIDIPNVPVAEEIYPTTDIHPATSTAIQETIFQTSAPLMEKDDFKPMSIEDLVSPSQIEGLNVRQLKLLLTRNFVDYKGCCEKQELQEKVFRLFAQKEETKNIDEVPDENLCKICMEAPIDSVLLECGHMVTCTDCGKRLHECPICRQYVVRVVHTFKA